MKPLTLKEMASMGGHARAAKLTKKQLSEIGTKAVMTRWRKVKQGNNNKGHKKPWKKKSRTRTKRSTSQK
jgi:hypothetical protein